MNQKILIGAAVVLVLLLATPLVLNQAKKAPETPVPVPAPATTVPPPPVPVPTTPPPVIPNMPVVYAPPEATIPQYQQNQGQNQMPALTAESLVGTAWEVSTPHGPVQIELGPNGQATASHPMVGNIPGNWRAQGTKVTASASFMGQSMSMEATIQGNTLSAPGQNIRRLR